MQTFFGSGEEGRLRQAAFDSLPACQGLRRGSRSASQHDLFRYADVFRLREKSQCLLAAFAADAARFHAAKRDAEVAHEPAVYPNRAGGNPFGDAMGAVQVLCPDARSQAVIAVVSIADYFFFAIERRDGDDRAENFFAICPT